MRTVIRLTAMPHETSFVPLGVLGYCLTRTEFLAPIWTELKLPQKTVDHMPEAKLQDLIVSIMAGCRSISQVNTRVRPDAALACAWDRHCFADQSTLARTLDTFGPTEVAQLRQGSEALFRRESQLLRHDFEHEWLWLNIDLTPLPISKHAEGSTKGKFAKKTLMVGNWPGYMRRSTTRPFSRASIPASKIASLAIFPCWRLWNRVLACLQARSNARSCVLMLVLAAMPTSTMP